MRKEHKMENTLSKKEVQEVTGGGYLAVVHDNCCPNCGADWSNLIRPDDDRYWITCPGCCCDFYLWTRANSGDLVAGN